MKRVNDASARLAEGFELLRKDARRQLAADASRVPKLAQRMARELSAPTAVTVASIPQGAALAGSLLVKGGKGLLIVGAVVAAGWQLLPRAVGPVVTVEGAAPARPQTASTPLEAAAARAPSPQENQPSDVASRVAAVGGSERKPAKRSAPRTRTSARGVEDESALIERARASVLQRPAEAVQLCREHASLYPQGVFVQEREVLAIEALLGARQRRAAETRALRFLERFPRSSHAHRVQNLVVRDEAAATTPERGHTRK
jgi:hypothetical protein